MYEKFLKNQWNGAVFFTKTMENVYLTNFLFVFLGHFMYFFYLRKNILMRVLIFCTLR